VKAAKDGMYYLTDLQGKVIRSGRVQAGVNTIALSGVGAGVYFVRMESGEVFKVIVQ